MIQSIEVLSRIKAIEYSYKKEIPKSIIISISEPHSKVPYFDLTNPQIIEVLPLFFDDITEAEKAYCPDAVLMTYEDVLAIKTFLERYKASDYTLIVHCYAGISRSSAVAAASALYLGLSDDFIWDDFHYSPNHYVFSLMNEVLQLNVTPEAFKERYNRSNDAFDVYHDIISQEETHD